MAAPLAAAAFLSSFVSMWGSQQESEAIRQAGQANARIFDVNARFSELQAEDAIRRGDREALALRGEGRRLRGAQRAAYAGQGVDVNSGAPVEVGAGTDMLLEQDVQAIKSNAWREAWGLKVQALDYRMRGEAAEKGAQQQAENVALAGALKAGGSFAEGLYSSLSYGSSGTTKSPSTPMRQPTKLYGGFGRGRSY